MGAFDGIGRVDARHEIQRPTGCARCGSRNVNVPEQPGVYPGGTKVLLGHVEVALFGI
jgi:hypothetical protein